MSQNKVTFGLEKVHLAFLNVALLSQPAWNVPIAVPGAVRWTPSAVGETSTFYADNLAYFVITSNNGYTGELELANVPDAIKAEMLGWEIDSNGMLVEIADAIPKPFALLGQIQGDKRNRRFVYYHCVANRPAKENTTKNESITPATDVLTLTVSPIEIAGKNVVKGDLELSDTNSAAYNAFFSAVTTPATPSVNKAMLANAIAVANSLTEESYTAETWGALEAELSSATSVNADANATQNQVDAALSRLQHAISALEVE